VDSENCKELQYWLLHRKVNSIKLHPGDDKFIIKIQKENEPYMYNSAKFLVVQNVNEGFVIFCLQILWFSKNVLPEKTSSELVHRYHWK
jgi:hypothetical protein